MGSEFIKSVTVFVFYFIKPHIFCESPIAFIASISPANCSVDRVL